MNNAASKLFNEWMGRLDKEKKLIILCRKNEFCYRYNINDLFLDDHSMIIVLCHQ